MPILPGHNQKISMRRCFFVTQSEVLLKFSTSSPQVLSKFSTSSLQVLSKFSTSTHTFRHKTCTEIPDFCARQPCSKFWALKEIFNWKGEVKDIELERDWNSENSAFCSKSSPPYVPRVLYEENIARALTSGLRRYAVSRKTEYISFFGRTQIWDSHMLYDRVSC